MLGNRLDAGVTFTLQDWIQKLQGNAAVKMMVFQSSSFDMFSVGLNGESSVEEVEGLHSLSGAIAESKTPTVAVYGGEMNGTAYAAFAGCTYRLGTPSFHFRIDEILEHNTMPKGGLAYHFNQASPTDGKAMARYLAISGHNVSGEEMYAMGLLSHLTEEDPESSLTNAVAHTLPDRGAGEYKSPVRGDTVGELLDDMSLDSDLDVFQSELWDEYLLVPPNRWDVQEKEEIVALDDKDMQDLDLYDVNAWVINCFGGSDNLQDCQVKLTAMAEDKGMAAQWATGCLQAIKSADQRVVEAWWACTSDNVASNPNLVQAKEMEAP